MPILSTFYFGRGAHRCAVGRDWHIATFRCAAKFGRYWTNNGHSETPPPEIIWRNLFT